MVVDRFKEYGIDPFKYEDPVALLEDWEEGKVLLDKKRKRWKRWGKLITPLDHIAMIGGLVVLYAFYGSMFVGGLWVAWRVGCWLWFDSDVATFWTTAGIAVFSILSVVYLKLREMFD